MNNFCNIEFQNVVQKKNSDIIRNIMALFSDRTI